MTLIDQQKIGWPYKATAYSSTFLTDKKLKSGLLLLIVFIFWARSQMRPLIAFRKEAIRDYQVDIVNQIKHSNKRWKVIFNKPKMTTTKFIWQSKTASWTLLRSLDAEKSNHQLGRQKKKKKKEKKNTKKNKKKKRRERKEKSKKTMGWATIT